jgi:glycosyltransferase involved in cell wall biosynthesis
MTRLRDGLQESLRILHVIDGIGIGGAESVLLRLLEGLQANGHHNAVVSLMNPGRLSERLASTGAVVEGLGFARGRLPGPASLRLRAPFRTHRPDIVQGWMYHGNLAASVGRWVAGCTAPMVWSIRSTLSAGPGPDPEFKPHTRLAIRLGAVLSAQTAAIVYVSEKSTAQHERIGFRQERSVTIRNGIDCERFRPDREARTRLRGQLGLPQHTPLVGLFARWDPVKGHVHLLAAARRLLEEGRSIHLVLAGSGIEPGNRVLTDAIEATGVSPHVSLLGERDDIEILSAALDVFALPSLKEAFPNALGEAMAAGVPCIATDVGDCAWMLDDIGYIVPPGDPVTLAAGLGRLLEMTFEERQQIGAAARRRVLQNFSLPQMIRQYEELYLGLSAREGV